MPILYSFRRCPYAMRARLALASSFSNPNLSNQSLASNTRIELREVVLRNKPAELIQASSKATVPVLVLEDGRVIDESLDIMLWALEQQDPEALLQPQQDDTAAVLALIERNDGRFKQALDKYKYFERFPEQNQDEYYQAAEFFLLELEQRLEQGRYLCGNTISLADLAIWPFIRQFAGVDRDKFADSAPPKLQAWLAEFLASERLTAVMRKYPAWQSGDDTTWFPSAS